MRLTTVLVKARYLLELKGWLQHPVMARRAESIVRNHGSCYLSSVGQNCAICPVSSRLCSHLYKEEIRFVVKAALYAHNKNRCAEL